jgi:glycosyltransferase involved in cell wall biosynthesis
MPYISNTLTPDLSVVIPCYNEACGISELQSRLVQCLNRREGVWEVIFVDDGSEDGTFDELVQIHRKDYRFKLARLSRNFGQQAAICAGLCYSTGRVVTIMDADMQDPPELLDDCLKKVNEGCDVVYMVRRKRKEGVLKRAAYRSFYWIFDLLSE